MLLKSRNNQPSTNTRRNNRGELALSNARILRTVSPRINTSECPEPGRRATTNIGFPNPSNSSNLHLLHPKSKNQLKSNVTNSRIPCLRLSIVELKPIILTNTAAFPVVERGPRAPRGFEQFPSTLYKVCGAAESCGTRSMSYALHLR